MKLKKDMINEMAIIARVIPTIAYNEIIPVGAFRYNNWRVVLNKREIHVRDIEKEADAVEVINYLRGLVEKAGENSCKE